MEHRWTRYYEADGDVERCTCWVTELDYGGYSQEIYEDGKGGPRRILEDEELLEEMAHEIFRLSLAPDRAPEPPAG